MSKIVLTPSDPEPQLPVWHCDACEKNFPVLRKWSKYKELGWQIIINWDSTEKFIQNHMQQHSYDLIKGIEDWLDAVS